MAGLAQWQLFRPVMRWLMAGSGFSWQMRTLFRLHDDIAPIAAGLRRLTCPTLLAWGMADDYIFPWRRHGERFRRDLPHARVAQIPGAGHFLQAERPAELLHHLADFLQQ